MTLTGEGRCTHRGETGVQTSARTYAITTITCAVSVKAGDENVPLYGAMMIAVGGDYARRGRAQS